MILLVYLFSNFYFNFDKVIWYPSLFEIKPIIIFMPYILLQSQMIIPHTPSYCDKHEPMWRGLDLESMLKFSTSVPYLFLAQRCHLNLLDVTFFFKHAFFIINCQLLCLFWGDVLNTAEASIVALSPALFQMKFLTHLYLSKNKLTFIGPDIRNLRALTVLDVSYNGLESLPSTMGELTEVSLSLIRGDGF